MEEAQVKPTPSAGNKSFLLIGAIILVLGILGAGAYYWFSMNSLPANGNLRKVEFVAADVTIADKFKNMSYADITDQFYGLVEERSEADETRAAEITQEIIDLQIPAAVKAVAETKSEVGHDTTDIYEFDLANGFTVTVSHLENVDPRDLNEYAKLVVARWPFVGDQPEDSIVILDSFYYSNLNAEGDTLVMIVKDAEGKVVGGVDSRYYKVLGGNDISDYEGLSTFSVIAPDTTEILVRVANNLDTFAPMVNVEMNAPRLIMEADVREDTTDIRHELPSFSKAAEQIAAQANFVVPTFARNAGTLNYSGVEINGGYALIETDHSEKMPVSGLESMRKTKVYYDVTEIEPSLLKAQFEAAIADAEVINYQYGDLEFTTLDTEAQIAALDVKDLMDNLDTLVIVFTGKDGNLPTVTISEDYLDVYSLGDQDALVSQRFVVEMVE